jgi:hypothetical protein
MASEFKCRQCGVVFTTLSRFCPECGAPQPSAWFSTSANQAAKPTESGWARNEPSKQNNLGIYFGIAAVVVFVLACIFWFNSHPTSPKAQYELGMKYETGQGVQQNETQAVYWYQKAADQGYAAAQDSLGVMYESGSGGLAKDDAQAIVWYQKAADQGDSDSQYQLGVMYENGRGGLTKDDSQAVYWYQKSANQGNDKAKVRLATVQAQMKRKQELSDAVHWPKSQCIKAINNFNNNSGFLSSLDSIRASAILLALEGLSNCGEYYWAYEERSQLPYQIPYSKWQSTEQSALNGFLSARISRYLAKRNLYTQFISRLLYEHPYYRISIPTTIMLNGQFEFLNQHGLMKDFFRDDDLQFAQPDFSNRIKVTHDTALLLGLQ